jgi:hypothetical protein
MVAAKMANLERGDNQHTANAVTSQADAATLLNVSVDSVQRAKTVQASGDQELIEQVENGEISVSAAAKNCTDPVS